MSAVPWEDLVGQERAVELLQQALVRPVHAYLLVGPPGSAYEDAARHFAAGLVAPEDADAVRRVLAGIHPDVVEFRPDGAMYTLANEIYDPRPNQSFQRDRLLPRIVPEASRAPTEGAYKVIVVHEAERLQGNQAEAANALLKTLEEPPPRTVVVLTTSVPGEILDTVESRCQRIDFASAGIAAPDAIVQQLRQRFRNAPLELDGTGAAASRMAGELDDAIRSFLADFEAELTTEAETLTADMTAGGYDDRTIARLARRLAEQHKRRLRKARRDALVEGITAIETLLRDALAGPDAPTWVAGSAPVTGDPRACARAIDACREAREALEFNPNEGLLLERLALHLPTVTAAG